MIILLDEGPVQILANVRGTVPLIYGRCVVDCSSNLSTGESWYWSEEGVWWTVPLTWADEIPGTGLRKVCGGLSL
jgi:hypothetical protein